MNNEIVIRVFDIVDGPLCISAEDGQAVHDKIAPFLRDHKPIVISFAGVTDIISAFLNAAIGQLYGEFSESLIRELLTVRDLAPDDLDLVKRVNSNAKVYFKNRQNYDQAWKEEVGDEE